MDVPYQPVEKDNVGVAVVLPPLNGRRFPGVAVQLPSQQKLTLLPRLASEAFGELDEGRGIVLDDEQQMSEFIGGIGRRAAEMTERRIHGD